jgi:L-aspartate oxidase
MFLIFMGFIISHRVASGESKFLKINNYSRKQVDSILVCRNWVAVNFIRFLLRLLYYGMTETIQMDYLVIGAGIAGLSAAQTIAKSGQKVGVLTKGPVRESNTHYAQGGIAVAMREDDSPRLHFEDTLVAGDGLCDSDMVRILVEEGPEHVRDLIRIGAQFDKSGGDYSWGQEGAHQHRRILHAGDATGREIEKALGRSLLNDPNVTFFSHTYVRDLIMNDGECVGCEAIRSDKPVRFVAKATILATGGACQLFERNTNPPMATGDGMAMAYAHGAVLKDMEFVQFHPTTLYSGDHKPISLFLISEAVRGEGAILRNSLGERFMPGYDDRAELAPRDVVSRAIFSEINRTGANCVYLDLTAIDVDIPSRFPTIFERCLKANIDVRSNLIPVAPAAHYFIGGIQTDDVGRTSIPRLYAVGEVAATGIHGANRLASNSLLEGLVFGARAGGDVVSVSDMPVISTKSKHSSQMNSNESVSAILVVKEQIRQIMWEKVGIVRDAEALTEAATLLESFSWIKEGHVDALSVIEVRHMLNLAQLMVRSALDREESRGCHFRSDFPDRNDGVFSRHFVTESASK